MDEAGKGECADAVECAEVSAEVGVARAELV